MAYAIGIDIGTTTICACVLDIEAKAVKMTYTRKHSFLKSHQSWERLQDVEEIVQVTQELLKDIEENYPDIACIGLTGQMHGIVYVDKQGDAVSPLITWQDERGNLLTENMGETYAQQLERLTAHSCATGFGSVTHYYNVKNGLIPDKAVSFCTIHDYLFMVLCGRKNAVTHPTDGASIGLYDRERGCFDRDAIEKAGMDFEMFPQVEKMFSGRTTAGIPVAIPLGDNQASIFGAVKDLKRSILVNIGTGSQVSVWSESFVESKTAELRPFIGQDFIAAGSVLCGGKSYALLESFFREVVELCCAAPESLYEIMNRLAEEGEELANPLNVCTTFCGTRSEPDLRGKIENIGMDNFTPRHLISGFLKGSAEELYGLYEELKKAVGAEPLYMVGAGNGLRSNLALQKIIKKRFQMELKIPQHREEAAFGAALYALYCCIHMPLDEIHSYIQYI